MGRISEDAVDGHCQPVPGGLTAEPRVLAPANDEPGIDRTCCSLRRPAREGIVALVLDFLFALPVDVLCNSWAGKQDATGFLLLDP